MTTEARKTITLQAHYLPRMFGHADGTPRDASDESELADAIDQAVVRSTDSNIGGGWVLVSNVRPVQEADLDPLHARARKAIEVLGLDGGRFERAVALFGWGSDEANGSLLGLACAAWDDPHIFVRFRTTPTDRFPDGCWRFYLADASWVDGEDKAESLIAALEAKASTR